MNCLVKNLPQFYLKKNNCSFQLRSSTLQYRLHYIWQQPILEGCELACNSAFQVTALKYRLIKRKLANAWVALLCYWLCCQQARLLVVRKRCKNHKYMCVNLDISSNIHLSALYRILHTALVLSLSLMQTQNPSWMIVCYSGTMSWMRMTPSLLLMSVLENPGYL